MRIKTRYKMIGFFIITVILCILYSTTLQISQPQNPELMSITLMLEGKENQVIPNDISQNPIKKWLIDNQHIDLQLINSTNFYNDVFLKFSSNEPPDIVAGDYNQIIMPLYKNDYLMEDWTPYLEYIPTIQSAMLPDVKKALTVNDKLICLSDSTQPQDKSLKIRADWLQNLHLPMPQTPKELFQVAYEFTYSDPDLDGKNNTYAFTSSGNSNGFGDELEILQCMWGPPDFYVKDNKVLHPMVDGNRKKFLNFVKSLIENQLIDPDWYTQGEEQKQFYLNQKGKVGFAYGSGAIVLTTDQLNGDNQNTLGWWKNMMMPKENFDGGKYLASSLYTNTKSVSRKAFMNQKKFYAVLKLLEICTYPNEGYWNLKWGLNCDNAKSEVNTDKYVPNSLKYIYLNPQVDYMRLKYTGLQAYGNWIYDKNDGVMESSIYPTSNELIFLAYELNERANLYPQYKNLLTNYNFDPVDVLGCERVKQEYELMYVLGEIDDFNLYLDQWLKNGGSKMLYQATKRLTQN